MLIDTHCHVHEADYPIDIETVINNAADAGVKKMICIGTCEDSSRRAIELASRYDNVFASIGVHPHYSEDNIDFLEDLLRSTDKSKLVAIGEIGLDYYYNNAPRDAQMAAFETQIKIAMKYNMPIIFHVREAYDDFWSIIDKFPGIRGVLHSFTDNMENCEKGLERGLFFGINGISTFTKDESQKLVYKTIPVEKIMLETDAPFLTPAPLRGKIKINEPAFIKNIAEFNSSIHNMKFDEFAAITTANASALFKL